MGVEIDSTHAPEGGESRHEPARTAAGVQDLRHVLWRAMQVGSQRAKYERVQTPVPEVIHLETKDAVEFVGLHLSRRSSGHIMAPERVQVPDVRVAVAMKSRS